MLCSAFCRGMGIRERVINSNRRLQPVSSRSCHFGGKHLNSQMSTCHVCFHSERKKHGRTVLAACLIRLWAGGLIFSVVAERVVADGSRAQVRMSPELSLSHIWPEAELLTHVLSCFLVDSRAWERTMPCGQKPKHALRFLKGFPSL